ncbi:hypothetical protein GF378_02695 [Candidatus Pacearchaeota archaeon]|nr:hypothetical protein [Candidatus Pacearchaeota archaeon]
MVKKKKTKSKKKKKAVEKQEEDREDSCSFSVGPNKVICSEHKGPGAFYGLGFLGAVIYYISTATGFWNGVLGVLKAIVWPAMLIFEVLKFIGA